MTNGFMDNMVKKNLTKMHKMPLYRIFLIICGFPVFLVTGLMFLARRLSMGSGPNAKAIAIKTLKDNGADTELEAEVWTQLQKKHEFLQKNPTLGKVTAEKKKIFARRFNELVAIEMIRNSDRQEPPDFMTFFISLFKNPAFTTFSFVFGFPALFLVLIFANPYIKFIFERLLMMVFVIFGVTFLVFTILYMSPMDPAVNILGQHATVETVAEFNRVYGLDKSYTEQLVDAFTGIITFNMGRAYMGNEDVVSVIMRLFPITLTVAFWSLFVSLAISIPAGIVSAIKPYSAFDYVFMFFALLGLSIPNFWLGLILILNFSINLGWLPPIYSVSNWMSLIMPVIVLGTGLAASVARMTRSSMLEVIKQDYVVTARAKGLPYSKVVLRHILGNAMIPIITVVGLQFGGMLGGAAITERVFNIRGLGSYIVERQFIPDIPIVLAGTVYIAIVVSITNLIVDIMYAFLDPRIKSGMKNY
ncbi:MAG: ABC transporter permease [Treponema sp.]|nr:ABC transporter permease [Treponema sp.]